MLDGGTHCSPLLIGDHRKALLVHRAPPAPHRRQLSDFAACEPAEIDSVLAGIRKCLLGDEPQVPLSEYVPKAMTLLGEKQAKVAEAMAAKGAETLAAAAKEEGAVQTASGLVVQTLSEGKGDVPTRESTVKVHYEGQLVDGSIFDSSYRRGKPAARPGDGGETGRCGEIQLGLRHPLAAEE